MANETTDTGSFQTLYLKEKKKARIFLISTAIALVAFLATGVGLITQLNDSPQSRPSALGPSGQDGQGGQGQFPGGNGGPGNGGPGMMLDISGFFSSDGSVDSDKVDELTENIPDDFKDQLFEDLSTRIDNAVSDGDITSDQGDALKSALGITA